MKRNGSEKVPSSGSSTGLFKYTQYFFTIRREIVKEFFLWEFFINKFEIYFVVNNAGCNILEAVTQGWSSK